MPKREDIKKILVIGSGPIVIGQAAEFDYAGTQCCLALKEEGYQVVLANSNPATIMTDLKIADKVYMEPLDLEYIAKIIRTERPDGIICSMGGQTGLNLGMQLYKKGILEECQVEMLGPDYNAINNAEDRLLFKNLCDSIGEPTLSSVNCASLEEVIKAANEIGFPLILRPAFTLGGTGGGFANNMKELEELAKNALKLSPVHEVLVEKSIKGFKEIEFEVIRDKYDNAIVVCSMENLDPVGIHTGDSIVVAPAQTLTYKEYNMLASAALKIIRALKIEGGCNVQFSLDPYSFEYYVIEVNPRVSRSSALASKASGYPIARVSAKIACGLGLNEIDLGNIKASLMPTIDYVVLKFPRFPFDKFNTANRKLSTQMKATGEVMAIGTNFEEAFLKAIRSLENKVYHVELKKLKNLTDDELISFILEENDERIYALAEALRRNISINYLNDLTKIDKFFLDKLNNIILIENKIKNEFTKENFILAKEYGFSDKYLASILNKDEFEIFEYRKENNIFPVYKKIDSCAGEFESDNGYLYSTYKQYNESVVSDNKKIIVLGSGPIRIGQGVEFDYSTVHAIWAIREAGYEAIIINNNPETVSTDYSVSDKLYFEPLCYEDVKNIIELEKPLGVVVSLGGQTAINLASDLEKHGVKIIGSSSDAIDACEDRKIFEQKMTALEILMPIGKGVLTIEEGIKTAKEIGYPVLVRPSFVLGGRMMHIVNDEENLISFMKEVFEFDPLHPLLIDKYIRGVECEVDAITDGKNVFIPGIMEHIEKTGVHSGDSMSVYPPHTLNEKAISVICDYTKKIGLNLGLIGLYNIQFIVSNDKVYVIEVNPRSSRTVPFMSKATNVSIANLAAKVMLGYSLKDLGYVGLYPNRNKYFVKTPTFSFTKITGIDVVLTPEMKSTGEAIGYDRSLNRALYKSLKASGLKVSNYGTVLATIADSDKEEALSLIKRFYELGFNIVATSGTAKFLKQNNIRTRVLKKISEGSEDIIDLLRKGHINYVINTTTDESKHINNDGAIIRRTAIDNNVAVFTCLDTVKVLLDVLEETTMKISTIDEE